MLENKRGVNKLDRIAGEVFSGEIGAMQFQPVDSRIALTNRAEVCGVDVHAYDATGDFAIDVPESISARDPEYSHAGGTAMREGFRK